MATFKHHLKQILPPILTRALTRKWRKGPPRVVPDQDLYRPLFSPWLGLPGFRELLAEVMPHTLVSPDRCWVLYCLARQAITVPGNFYEAGVYRGGTALLLKRVIERTPKASAQLRLFDTFAGMPETDPQRDFHRSGDFVDTSLDTVRRRLGAAPFVHFHPGFIPQTFAGLEPETISLAHIDVDIYRSVLDCCAFIYPRLSGGGFMIFDDYGFPSCPGARAAVDEFFAGKPEVPLVLPTGQAIVFRSLPRR